MKHDDLVAPDVSEPILVGSGASPAGDVEPIVIQKSWGRELVYANDEKYCCKVLYIEPGKGTSLYFYLNKHETMLVVDGELLIEYVFDKQLKSVVLEPAKAFVILPGLVHKLFFASDTESVTFVETSTISYDTDSIRIGT
jgi:mannose-6-phosphate isomerase-like protein (cupin superfamily)